MRRLRVQTLGQTEPEALAPPPRAPVRSGTLPTWAGLFTGAAVLLVAGFIFWRVVR